MTAQASSDSNIARAKALGANFANLSAVEQGARRGLGPLSPLGARVWHGESRPCVSCGQLIRRTAGKCEHCGQLLTGDMIQKMKMYSGPWYVLEHVRPFPGVSKERLIKQIKRGVMTQTTIVRGPTTHHQWRYAAETPGLSKYLGVCWSCQASVHEDDGVCASCGKSLDSDGEEALIEGDETLAPQPAELERLRAAVGAGAPRQRSGEGPSRIGPVRASWLITALVLLIMIGVYWLVSWRQDGIERPAPRRPTTAPRLGPDWTPAPTAPESTGPGGAAADAGPPPSKP